jgi:hypothetical protein
MASSAATVRRLRHSFEAPLGLRLDKLRKVPPRDLAVRFAFGFGVSVAAGLVTLEAGNRVGGLFLAFPAILPASLTLIDKREGRQKAATDVSGAVLGAVGLISFALVSWQLSGHAPLGITQGAAAAAWIATAGLLYFATSAVIRRGTYHRGHRGNEVMRS